jgi:hypothetical protein
MSAAFESIVAGLRADGSVPSWPEDRADGAASSPPEERAGAGGHHRRDTALPEVEPLPSGDDHFVPPEPPPLPPLGQVAAVGVGLLALGMLLLVAPDLLGLSESTGLPLGLITLAGGLSWLVLRSWSTDPEDGDDPENGAVF